MLGILANASIFPAHIQTIAKDVRSKVRNEWGHCNSDHWTDPEMKNGFQFMEKLLRSLGLSNADEAKVVADLCDWKEKGKLFKKLSSFQGFVWNVLLPLYYSALHPKRVSITIITIINMECNNCKIFSPSGKLKVSVVKNHKCITCINVKYYLVSSLDNPGLFHLLST